MTDTTADGNDDRIREAIRAVIAERVDRMAAPILDHLKSDLEKSLTPWLQSVFLDALNDAVRGLIPRPTDGSRKADDTDAASRARRALLRLATLDGTPTDRSV